jgi:hypothetical protein
MKDPFDTSGTALLLEIGHAANRNELTRADLKWLTQGDRLARFLPVIRGNAEIHIVRHVINLAANPHIPDRCKVEEHREGNATFEWNPNLIALQLSESQKNRERTLGNDLRNELRDTPVLNANLLDYLLKYPDLIPEGWKRDGEGNTLHIFFWGTIYRDHEGFLCVRYLYWNHGRWDWSTCWLSAGWGKCGFAACLANAT